jgi:RNA polymerase primary sigma factor
MVALIKDYTIMRGKDRRATRSAQMRSARPPTDRTQARPRWKAEPATDETEKAKVAAEARAAEPPAPPRNHELSSYGGNMAITLYIREIGRVKPLAPKEEIELAARIKQGDKKARERMIKANLRLVVKIARDFGDIGLSLLDLISEGNIGLIKAVERFDLAKDGKLSTYSAWWIKQSIKRALASQSKTSGRNG